MVFRTWEYDEGYNNITNRVYRTAGVYRPFLPEKYLEEAERHEYMVRFNISIYFCDSPDLEAWIVRRKIYGEQVMQILDHEYEGGLDAWVESMTHFIARRYRDSSWTELGHSLVFCKCSGLGGNNFKIEVIEKEYKPPVEIIKIPRDVTLRIERIEELIKEAETIDERTALEEELKRLKERFGIKGE